MSVPKTATGVTSARTDGTVSYVTESVLDGVVLKLLARSCALETGTDIGKPTGTDIKEKKMSLPLIYALEQSSYAEKKSILSSVKNKSAEKATAARILEFVKEKKGLEYAKGKMYEYREKSKVMLNELPGSPYKTAFEQLIEFVTERDK